MPKPVNHIPKLHRHATGRAFVKIDGQQVYLGRYGDPLAREEYDRLIAKWLAGGRKLPTAQTDDRPPTVSVVMAQFVRHIDQIHPTDHGRQIKDALAVLRRLYGSTIAAGFQPADLEAVRAVWIEKELTRATIARKVGFIRAMFRWATTRSLVPVTTWQSLMAVEGLRRGRSKAKESRKVRGVAPHLIAAIELHVAPQVWSLVQLQLLTGARCGELLRLSARDIDMSGKVWLAKIFDHKTAHHGHDRIIRFGPKAQDIIRPYLPPARAIDSPLFSPREAALWHKAKNASVRRRPNQKPNEKTTDRQIGDCYTNNSYRRAVERGLVKAFPIPDDLMPAKGDTPAIRRSKAAARADWRRDHKWHPHQLRHNAGTAIRRAADKDDAKVILGHSSDKTTAIYIDPDEEKATDTILKIG